MNITEISPVTNAAPEPKRPHLHLAPGQVNLDLIPQDWALTPIRNKKAYKPGWTSQPFSIEEVRKEFEEGQATGVGVMTGQWSNEGGLVWVDIDGPEGWKGLEEVGGGSIHAIFPSTLSITSGGEGKLRLLYKVPNHVVDLLPNKARIKIKSVPEKFEILWRGAQGVCMGPHPDTDGYRTTNHGGFEYASHLPDIPEWLVKEVEKSFPTTKYRKPVTSGLVAQNIRISYEEGSVYHKEEIINEAKTYLEYINEERAYQYDEWLAVGMCLHQVDESLLGAWIEWSQQAPNFEDGVCEQKWRSFERLEGGPSPEGSCGLHHLRAKAKEDGYVDLGNFVVKSPDALIKEAQQHFAEVSEEMPHPDAIKEIFNEVMGNPDRGMRNQINDRVKSQRKPKTPPASELAEFVTEMVVQCGWRYDPRYETFMFYQSEKGVWRREEYKHEYKHFVQDLFVRERIPTPGGFTSHLISDVVSLTQAYITHTYWDDDDDRLAFTNGVLEISTGEFYEHSSEHYMTWGLDFEYDPHADPGPIIEWLTRTQYGDTDRVQVLRAWLKACLVGQGHEIQRFLEVVGPGGRGKSTFANLCCALVGARNYASTTLNQLEQSRFEVASIKGKRLTLINDSERYGGSAQIFKALTGGDNLRFEEKNKNVGEPFVYTGMVMVCANEPIQTTDNTSGLTRRRLTIEFNRPLYSKNSEAKEMIKLDNGVVKGLWKHCLPGLVNWVLQMSDLEMREYLLDTYEKVPSLKRTRNEIMLNSNNLVEWIQSEVVLDEKAVSPVGKKIPAAKDAKERYCNSSFHLYASYASYCEDTGSKSVGQKRFIALMLDCFKNQLGTGLVSQFTKLGKPYVKGLALRASDQKYKDFPTILPEKYTQESNDP